MITKVTIAETFGITSSTIPNSLYLWAKKQFYVLTGLKEIITSKTSTKFIGRDTCWLKLPDTNISEITSLTVDGEAITFTIDDDVKYNTSTGLLWYGTGFAAEQKVVIVYKVGAYTHTDLHDYLITMLVYKGMLLFIPSAVNYVKSIKIGSFSKTFGGVDATLEDTLHTLDKEIKMLIDQINGNDYGLKFEAIT